jgi:hypothetical protein
LLDANCANSGQNASADNGLQSGEIRSTDNKIIPVLFLQSILLVCSQSNSVIGFASGLLGEAQILNIALC